MNVYKTLNIRSLGLKKLMLPLVLILQLSVSGVFSLTQLDSHLSLERLAHSGFSIEHVYAEDAEDKSFDLNSEQDSFYSTPAKRLISISSAPPEHYLHGSTHSRSPPVV